MQKSFRLNQELQLLLANSQPKLQELFLPIAKFLTFDKKCELSIGSSYATFSHDSNLVAAVYPAKSEIDLLLALPLDHSEKSLFDAVDRNYKWRNLPCGVSISTVTTAKVALNLTKRAFCLVESGTTQEQAGEAFARPKAAYQPAFKKKLRYR